MAPAKTCAEADGGKHTEPETEAADADGTCESAASLIILSFGRANEQEDRDRNHHPHTPAPTLDSLTPGAFYSQRRQWRRDGGGG